MPDCGDAKILQVLRRQVGRTVSSISFSRNAASYFPRPRLRSQTTMSMTARLQSGVAHIICLHCMMVELIDDFFAEYPATAGVRQSRYR